MKTITFTVQIQADINERPGTKKKLASDLCQDINRWRSDKLIHFCSAKLIHPL